MSLKFSKWDGSLLEILAHITDTVTFKGRSATHVVKFINIKYVYIKG